jgi:hypothetical protein
VGHYSECNYTVCLYIECCYTECRMLSVTLMSVGMPNTVEMSVVMLNVFAPKSRYPETFVYIIQVEIDKLM